MAPAKKVRSESVHPPEIARWVEWQEHQFDDGYWTGGRIPPLYHADRPNRYGWILIATGALSLAVMLMSVGMADDRAVIFKALISSPTSIFAALISVLAIASGVRLVRGPHTGRSTN